MAKRVAISTLNASTIDILNTIRQNASAQYQSLVPAVSVEADIPKVGEVLMGYPAMANEFLQALINRIAMVRIKSTTFNNAYADLKKGYLEFGETVEEVFVNIAKAREFSAEKAESREFKRTIPDVRSAFHIMNWKVQYPITIQNEDLRMAFTSFSGVEDMIARIVESVNVANEYDEFLLFKYLIIKAISHGKMYPVAIGGSNITDDAIAYRGMSNKLPFVSTDYNIAGVHTTTKKKDQQIFMSAEYNAQFDVNVLASAFNMEKAEFMGKLRLIDDWTTFDNDRFDIIRSNSDMIEAVSSSELAIMADVKAVIVDTEWFQIYDNLLQMSEQYVASGLYWNYFLNSWKTVSSSPFSNAIVFVANGTTLTDPASLTATVVAKDVSDVATVLTLEISDSASLKSGLAGNFVQNQECASEGVAVHKYGAIIFADGNTNTVTVDYEYNGKVYSSATKLGASADVGDTLTLSPAT